MRTRLLALASVVLLSLAGAVVDRALVAAPAWQQLGFTAWADYSRHADLGAGQIIYPVRGIAAWLAVWATAISYRFDPQAPRAAGAAVYLAALASLGAAVATVKAAPIMESVAGLADGSAGLQSAFRQFTVWGLYVRGAFFVVAFLASLWAVATLSPQGYRTARDDGRDPARRSAALEEPESMKRVS